MKQQLKTIIPLSLALFVLVSYQFIAASSVWSPAPGTPPNPNADMPIHTGASQTKSGGLSLSSLYTSGAVDANAGVEARNIAVGRCPFGSCSRNYETIQLPGTNNLRLNFGTSQRYIFYNNGHFIGNWIQANNQMRSNAYCDKNGANCINPAQDNIPNCAAGKILESKGSGAGWKCADKPSSSTGGTGGSLSVYCGNSYGSSAVCPSGMTQVGSWTREIPTTGDNPRTEQCVSCQ